MHAALTGLSLFIAANFEWIAGFGFSAGLVDYLLAFAMPLASQPYMLLVQGVFFAIIYYVLFRFLIVKLDLLTPGREEELAVAAAGGMTESDIDQDDATAVQAAGIIEGLGGASNIAAIDSCATRLRLEVNDMDKVNEARIKQTGVPGTNIVGKYNIQVIVGTSVQFVEQEVRKQVNKE